MPKKTSTFASGSARNSGLRLALSKAEAAEALSMSVDSFERHVLPELRVIRRGRLVLVAVRELERWLEHSAALTLREST
jgi:hypothetical protein